MGTGTWRCCTTKILVNQWKPLTRRSRGPHVFGGIPPQVRGIFRWFWLIFADDFPFAILRVLVAYFWEGENVKTVTLWKVKPWPPTRGYQNGNKWKKLIEGMQFGFAFPETDSKFIPEDGWNTFAFNFCGFTNPCFSKFARFREGIWIWFVSTSPISLQFLDHYRSIFVKPRSSWWWWTLENWETYGV